MYVDAMRAEYAVLCRSVIVVQVDARRQHVTTTDVSPRGAGRCVFTVI